MLTVAILSGVLATAFEAYAVLTAMPAAAQELGAIELYAWAFTAFVIAMAFATVLAGRATDRIGTVRPLAVGMSAFGIGLLRAGFAPSMPMLLLIRALQGFGGGLLNVALMVLIADAFDDRERPGLMTAFSFCWLLPSFLGPPVAAWITHTLGWRWVFWSTLPILLVSVAFGWRPLARLPASDRSVGRRSRPVPLWAAAIAACGVALVQLAGQRLNTSSAPVTAGGWPLTAATGVGGLVLLSLSVPKLMPAGFAHLATGLPAVPLERACQSGAFTAAESFIPLILLDEQHFTLVQAGWVITIGAVGWTLGSWVQSRAWLRLRRDQIILLGSVCGVLGALILLAGVAIPGAWVGWVAVGHTIAGLGMGLAVASTSLAVMTLSGPGQLGRNTSSLQVGDALGVALATGLAGSVFVALREQGNPQLTYGCLVGICLLCAIGAVGAALRIGPVRNDSAGVG